MATHGVSHSAIIDITSFGDYDAHRSTVGPNYRRAGPASSQRTFYFPGNQSISYGPYDEVRDFRNDDPFINQADEVDRHRRILSGAGAVFRPVRGPFVYVELVVA